MPAHRSAPIARVLAATDFSPGATAAVARAASLPLAHDGLLYVVHVMPARVPAKLRGQAEAAARRGLEVAVASGTLAARRAGNRGLDVRPVLVRGDGYVEIIRHARTRDVDLVVVGLHGRRPLRDLFLGSTAERVVRMSGSPVLVVKRKPTQPYRRPLAAIDVTDTARGGIDVMLRLIDPGTHLGWLVHAYQVPFEGLMSSALSSTVRAEYHQQWRDKAAAGLRRLASELGPANLWWKQVLRAGEPGAVILDAVERHRADLVALGTHARSGVAHALLGSVAARVLRSVPCDVVVTRPAAFAFELP
jgi:nucleotide-binding universal stress UspA family protein